MNLMLLASVAVILLCALIGYRRGLIKSAVSAVGIVGAVILTNVLNPYVNQFLCQHTPLRDTVRQKVEQSIGVEDISESVSVYEKEDYLEHTEPVSYTHLTLPTMDRQCISRWSPYH